MVEEVVCFVCEQISELKKISIQSFFRLVAASIDKRSQLKVEKIFSAD